MLRLRSATCFDEQQPAGPSREASLKDSDPTQEGSAQRKKKAILATPLPCLKRLLPEGASVHLKRLLGHEAEAKRLGGIEAFPKGVLHLENDITYTTVARIAFFDVHDVGRLGLGVLLVEAEGSILAPGGEVFGDN